MLCLRCVFSDGLSEQEFYVDLLYKVELIGRNYFSHQFIKVYLLYKSIRYILNVIPQSACLVFNPISIDNHAFVLIASRWVGRQFQ